MALVSTFIMIEASSRLTSSDKRALAIFAGLVGACSLYLASGKLIAYVSRSNEALEVAKDGKGFTVRVLGFQTMALAEQQSEELRNRYGAPVEIEAAPTGESFLIKVGPLAKLSDAEILMNKLRASHNSIVRIVRNCGPGIRDCSENQQLPPAHSVEPSDPTSNPIQDEGRQ
jgi:sporulation related protein